MTFAGGERDDAALVAAHVAGDAAAFGELFGRHRDRLWAVAVRTTGNPEDAADALQDAMISAFQRADSFRGQAAVTTWLHRIVVNACLDRLRRAKVRAADPLPDDLEQRAARGTLLTSAVDAGPEQQAEAADRRRQVLAALDELPPDQRAALVLVDMEGYPVQEAALILDAPVGTIKSRCARGRARLAVLLGDLGPASPKTGTGTGTGTDGTPGMPAASESQGRSVNPPDVPMGAPVTPASRPSPRGGQRP